VQHAVQGLLQGKLGMFHLTVVYQLRCRQPEVKIAMWIYRPTVFHSIRQHFPQLINI